MIPSLGLLPHHEQPHSNTQGVPGRGRGSGLRWRRTGSWLEVKSTLLDPPPNLCLAPWTGVSAQISAQRRFVPKAEEEGYELWWEEEGMEKAQRLPFGTVLGAEQGAEELGSNPSSAMNLLCALGQTTSSLWASSFLIFKWTNSHTRHLSDCRELMGIVLVT